MFSSVPESIAHHASHTPEAEALVLDDIRYSYRELAQQVDRCAAALINAGIRKGDRVATLSTPHPDFIITFLAASSIGAIWIGLNPRYQLSEYQYVVSDASPSLLFTRTSIGDRDFSHDIASLSSENASLKTVIVLNDDPLIPGATSFKEFIETQDTTDALAQLESVRARVEASDPALIIYTSGTTGKPKGALIPHRGLARVAQVQRRYWSPTPLRIINFLPINHIGSVGDISCFALVCGGAIVFMEQFDPAGCLQLIESEKITIWGAVPTAFQLCVSLPELNERDLSSLQLIVWGGAVAPAELISKLKDLCPNLSTSYGQTESVGSVTFVRPCDDSTKSGQVWLLKANRSN